MSKGIGNAILSDLKGIAGTVAHAVIYFPIAEKVEITTTGDEPDTGGLKKAEGLLKKAAAGIKGAVSAATQKVSGLTMPETGTNIFRVQFNPQTLQINARGGGRVPKTDYLKGDGKTGAIQYGMLDPYIEIRVTLLFDAVNNQDSFMADKFFANTTSLFRGAATALQVNAGKSYTVQPQVEGFLAALRDERKRKIVFRWGDLIYAGTLNHVGARYTMFNPVGNPVRAEVEIGLMCMGESSLQYWYARYSGVMNEKLDTAVGTARLGDRFNNILNL